MRTIGLLLGSAENEYGQLLIRGVHSALHGTNTRLICFTSSRYHAKHDGQSIRSILYDLVDEQNVDAVIIGGSLRFDVNVGEFAGFCRKFAPLPLVTISVSQPGIPSVVVDNRLGMSQLMDHLLQVHRYERLAYVSGNKGTQEAELRKALFLENMEKNGLPVPRDWIMDGEYTRSSGYAAGERLLATLEAHPERPAFQGVVAGNDPMAMGLKECFEDHGWRVPEDFILVGFDDIPESRIFTPPLTTVVQPFDRLAGTAAKLALAILDGQTIPEVTLIPTTLSVRASCACQLPDINVLNLAQLRERNAAVDTEFFQESRERIKTINLLDRLRSATENMLAAESFPQLLEQLDRHLGRIGFPGYWLALFADPEQPTELSRLHLAAEPGGGHMVSDSAVLFPSRALIPGGLRNLGGQFDLIVVEALTNNVGPMGFLVLATSLGDSMITGTLRGQISGAIKAVMQLEARRESERQLVQAEKMAALGSLVAGVAHEINTPLGVAITASSFQIGQLARFKRKYQAGQITKTEFESLLAELTEAGESVQMNLTRAADLVASFKQVSSDQVSEQRRQFKLKEYLEGTLVSLNFQWRKRAIEVSLEGPDELWMDSFPGTIAQIITNLISNSLLHGFPEERGGWIKISLEEHRDLVVLRYADNGAGIAAENLPKVFNPFFTTKRGQGGTGLGLHIIYNIVTTILGGTVRCESSLGNGTCFELKVPLKSPLQKGP